MFVLLAAAFQDIFLSVMTPKNRRAEASSDLDDDDFLSLEMLIIKSKIRPMYLRLLAFYGPQCIWTIVKLQSLIQSLKAYMLPPIFLTLALNFGSCTQNVTEAALLLVHRLMFPSVSNHDLVYSP